MKTQRTLPVRSIVSVLVVVLSLSSCVISSSVNPGAVQTSKQNFDLGQATSVKANIDAKTNADVNIYDGAGSLLAAAFTYNETLKPDVSYAVNGAVGTIDITQPSRTNLNSSKLDNVWDLQFGSDAPIDLSTHVTSGTTQIDVSAAQLTSLDLNTTSGNIGANLTGTQDDLGSIDVKVTSGSIDLDLGGSFPSLQTVAVTDASGNIHLSLDGEFRSPTSLDINHISGNTDVDLSGSWAHDLESNITTTSGNVTVRLPRDVGVRVSVSVASGKVTANGFRLDNDAYVNDAYGTSGVTLQCDIHVSSGNIVLLLGG